MRKLVSFLIFMIMSMPLFSAIEASSIYFADKEQLEGMVDFRGLSRGTEDEMRRALYEYEALEEHSYVEKEREGEYEIEILSSDVLTKSDGVITLSGDASLSFQEKGSGKRILYAGTIIVDTVNKKLTALDEVEFEDKSENASLDSIYADIVTVFWESGKIHVSEATTSSERKNSEDEKVVFYTAGEKLTYFPEGGILYENGIIASNPKTQYSSIKADTIAMLPGEDMFISDAWLSIGRVPILYMPFFFFPGSRVLGNPSFGFDSEKGAFLNATFELFGIDEKIESNVEDSSFTAIFRSGDQEGGQYPHGYYYDTIEKNTKLSSWARESDSYLSLSFDSYSGGELLPGGALHLGADSKLSFLDGRINLDLSDGIAFSSPLDGDSSKFRYYGENELSFSDFGLILNASYPFYSDDKVLVDFKNRLYGFSLDPILGQEPEFPDDVNKRTSSLSRSLSLSYSLPRKLTNDYLSSLKISTLTIKGVYDYDTSKTRRIDGKSVENPDYHTYVIDTLELPSLAINASGSLFSISKSFKKDVVEVDDGVADDEIHQLSDSLLAPLYTEKATEARARESKLSSSLKYSITSNYKNINEYEYGLLDENGKNFSLSSKVTLSFAFSNWFSLQDVITPSYSFNDNHEYEDFDIDVSETSLLKLNNDLTLKVPELGLSYSLSLKLINNKTTKDYALLEDSIIHDLVEKSDNAEFKWDKESVSQHKISFSKTFTLDIGSFTPSVVYTLKPLTGSLNPKLTYKQKGFSLSLSWKFLEDKEMESYKKDMLELSGGYTSTYFTTSTSFKYQSKDYDKDALLKPLSITSSLSLRSADKKYSITEAINFSFHSSKFNYDDYFDYIKTTISIPYLESQLNFKSDIAGGGIKFSDFNMKLSYSSSPFQFWKGRVYLKYGITSSFNMDESGFETASFKITPSLTFSIAEFLDFRFSFTSYNNSFYSYYVDDKFSFDLMWQDLLRSFDFVGNGRRNTFFVMDSAALEAVHYMEDWDLHCKYSAEVVKSGSEYSLLPRFSVYLSWKTLPELKVDEKWEQRLVDGQLEWVKSN